MNNKIGTATKGSLGSTLSTGTLYGNDGGQSAGWVSGVGSGGTGGGGGAGGVGGNGVSYGNGGNGGIGIQINISGVSYYWGGGGGGSSAFNGNAGNGGLGGGGGGASHAMLAGTGGGSAWTTGENGVTSSSGTVNKKGGNGGANTGGGGGASAAGGAGETCQAGNGGSGIVVIRFTTPYVSVLAKTENYQIQRWNDSSTYYNTDGIKFITYTDGNIGIGTTNPVTKLHIGSETYNSGAQNMRYFNYATAETAGSTTFTDTCSVFDSSIWVKSFIGSSSDTRIKKNIEDINDDSALQKILSIQPKTYHYIDPNRGSSNIYGFIAQQIREVIPEAVVTQQDTVPNIFSVAKCYKNTITFELSETLTSNLEITEDSSNLTVVFDYTSNLVVFDETSNIYVTENTSNVNLWTTITSNTVVNVVKSPPEFFSKFDSYSQVDIIGIDGNRCTYIITDIDHSTASITINKEIDSETVFVYGTQVNDFHTLDKSYIYTLNVCATQLLSQKIDQMAETITSQNNHITQLTDIISNLTSRIQALENK